jgi:hypothetical protein
MRGRQFVDRVWQWLNEERRLFEILVALLIIELIVYLLPQAPVSPSDGPALFRWLAELRPSLGPWVKPLSTLRLLSIHSSFWMRGLLTLLGLAIAVRVGTLREMWSSLPPQRRWLHGSICAAGLLVIAGWGTQMLWGWKESEVIAWPQQEISISARGISLPPQTGRFHLWSGKYGLYLIPKGESIGLEIQAVDEQGQTLPLEVSTRSEPQGKLLIAFTAQTSDAYFALSKAGYIFRVSQQEGATVPQIRVQAYRFASGELLTETVLDDDGALFVDGLHLQIDIATLPRFEAVYNPGALPEALGVLLLAVGAVVHKALPGRIRQSDVESLEEAATLPEASLS